MGRPSLRANEPSARAKLHAAFWEALEEKPFYEITVSEIARRAAVNKNTLYYHYHNLNELAQGAINESLLTDVPDTLFAEKSDVQELSLNERIELLPQIIARPDNLERWKKLRLIIGNHGTNELSSYLKECILKTIANRCNIKPENIPIETRIHMLFAINGFFGIVSSGMLTPKEQENILAQVYGNEIIQIVMKEIIGALNPDMIGSQSSNQ